MDFCSLDSLHIVKNLPCSRWSTECGSVATLASLKALTLIFSVPVQGVLNIFISNLLVLVPMVLTAHPGTKYGVPFPVLTRASFGIRGAHVPSILRALVACGWFGIQTWVGGSSMHTLLNKVAPAMISPEPVAWLGIKISEFVCFMAFWAIQVAIIWEGVECIRLLEKCDPSPSLIISRNHQLYTLVRNLRSENSPLFTCQRYSAPVLIGLSVALLLWAVGAAGGLGPMLSAPSQFGIGMPKAGMFWQIFVPSLTANVGYWATLSLNIPDFSRYGSTSLLNVDLLEGAGRCCTLKLRRFRHGKF